MGKVGKEKWTCRSPTKSLMEFKCGQIWFSDEEHLSCIVISVKDERNFWVAFTDNFRTYDEPVIGNYDPLELKDRLSGWTLQNP